MTSRKKCQCPLGVTMGSSSAKSIQNCASHLSSKLWSAFTLSRDPRQAQPTGLGLWQGPGPQDLGNLDRCQEQELRMSFYHWGSIILTEVQRVTGGKGRNNTPVQCRVTRHCFQGSKQQGWGGWQGIRGTPDCNISYLSYKGSRWKGILEVNQVMVGTTGPWAVPCLNSWPNIILYCFMLWSFGVIRSQT